MNRLHRPGHATLAALVVVLAGLAAACVAPPPAPEPTPTTSAAPTTAPTTTPTTTPTSSSVPPTPLQLCEEDLQTFAQEANEGTYVSPAFTVEFSGITALDNPNSSTSPTQPGSPSSLSIGVQVYDEDGDPIAPSPTQPLFVNVYGGAGAITAPSQSGVTSTGTDPLTLEITSGSSFELDYDGSYLPAPPTVQGALQLDAVNGCTSTDSWSIGADTVPFTNPIVETGSAEATLPAVCDSGAPGTCPTETVQSTGIRVDAVFGYAEGWPTSATAPPAVSPAPGDVHPFTVDTGSIGAAAPIDQLGPNVIGPAGPASKFYDSSGYEYMGFLYLAPVSIRDEDDGLIATIPIRVLGVQTSGCVPGYSCTSAPDPGTFHYLGVGFDRNTPGPGDQLASPTDNALLQLQAPGGGHFAPGYIASGTGVQVGLTSSQLSGFATTALTTSSTVPGDWLTSPGHVSITPPAGSDTPTSTGVLVDTGITEMFVDAAPGTSGLLHLDGADTVGVMVGADTDTPQLQYSFLAGTGLVPAATGMNPSSVGLLHKQTSGVFVNTGRYVLFQQEYLFDARRGEVGFRSLSSPLR